ncbi:MAG: glycosyltransferase [Candidatus Marinimicrobia bacterium]|nr:glycosyltransferase [Candidatus Neomarinimicrobiota bacterium]
MTYNHEKFIRDAIEGFLMQKTSFPVEILIHDDASTDSTADIIREYERKYPHLIKPVYQLENQYSKKRGLITKIQNERTQGKYVAKCEGDDYWTDPGKLQKQVDFLESHPDHVLCCSGYETLVQETGERTTEIETRFMKDPDGFSFTLLEMSISWFTKPLTSMFRSEIIRKDPAMLTSYRYCRDVHLFYHLMKEGRGYYFNEVYGVYRIHPGGIKSLAGARFNKNIAYERSKELYERNRDTYTRVLHLRSVSSLLKYDLRHGYPDNTLKRRCLLLLKLLKYGLSPSLIVNFVKVGLKMRKRGRSAGHRAMSAE